MKPILFVLTMVCAVSLSAAAQSPISNVEAEIKQREQAWHAALLNAGAGLEDLYSLKLTYLDWNGTARERAVLMADVKSGQLKYRAIKARKESVQVMVSTAIYQAELTLEGHYGTTSISRTAKLLHVWVKENGAWRLLLHQTEKLAE